MITKFYYYPYYIATLDVYEGLGQKNFFKGLQLILYSSCIHISWWLYWKNIGYALRIRSLTSLTPSANHKKHPRLYSLVDWIDWKLSVWWWLDKYWFCGPWQWKTKMKHKGENFLFFFFKNNPLALVYSSEWSRARPPQREQRSALHSWLTYTVLFWNCFGGGWVYNPRNSYWHRLKPICLRER